MYELFTIPLLRQRGTFLWSQRTSAKVNTHEKDVRASSLSKATLFGTHESESMNLRALFPNPQRKHTENMKAEINPSIRFF